MSQHNHRSDTHEERYVHLRELPANENTVRPPCSHARNLMANGMPARHFAGSWISSAAQQADRMHAGIISTIVYSAIAWALISRLNKRLKLYRIN